MQRALSCTYPDPGFWTRTSWIQLGYGVWVNLSMVVIGLAFGFPAVALPQLSTSNSTINTTVSDQSWIASVLTLASPPGCVISGYLTDKVGRRMLLIFSHLPVVLGWLYSGLATTPKDLIIGRIITGFGNGMVVVVPRLYLTEISLPNMRGVIGSFPNLAISIGITLQAALGSYFRWYTLCYICTGYSLALLFFNYFLPESPYYLLMNDTAESAEVALRKFRSAKHDIDAEMEELKDFKTDNNIHELNLKEKLLALCKRSSWKPFYIMMVYVLISLSSGVTVVTTWTVDILENSKSSVDSHLGNFLLGVTRFLSGVLMAFLMFQLGRRPLALFSGLGVGIVCVTLGLFILYTHQKTILPQICYMAYITFATLGHYTLPVLIMFELYPLQVRGILGGISNCLINFGIFAVNKLYPTTVRTFGFAQTIVSFGIFSFLGCIFLYFYLPETKDLTLQEIEEYYNELRPTLTSQRRIVSMMQLSKSNLDRKDTVSKSLIRITDKRRKGRHDKPNKTNPSEISSERRVGSSTTHNTPDKSTQGS